VAATHGMGWAHVKAAAQQLAAESCNGMRSRTGQDRTLRRRAVAQPTAAGATRTGPDQIRPGAIIKRTRVAQALADGVCTRQGMNN
jgi:hypothetical protein